MFWKTKAAEDDGLHTFACEFRMHNFSLSVARLEPQGCFPSEFFLPEGFYVKSVLGLKGTKQLGSLLVVGKDPFVFCLT